MKNISILEFTHRVCVCVCGLLSAGLYANVCVPDKRLSGGGHSAAAATDKPFST